MVPQVVLATGGVWPGGDPADQPTDKTEFLTASATAWQMAEPLPMVMQLLTNSILTVDNVVYLIGKLLYTETCRHQIISKGGNGINDGQNATDAVLEWNKIDLKWIETGSVLNSPRINHAVGAIPYSFLEFCP